MNDITLETLDAVDPNLVPVAPVTEGEGEAAQPETETVFVAVDAPDHTV